MNAEKKECGWWGLHFGLAFVVGLFSIQVYILISQLNGRPTASSFTLVDDVPPKLPSITVCPSMPFPPHVLIELGINASCTTEEDCNNALMTLDGLPEDLGLEELLNASLLPLSTYVLSSSIHGVDTTYNLENFTWPHWKVSKTAMGLCWTLVPPVQKEGESIQLLNLRFDSQMPCSRFLGKVSVFDLPREKVQDTCNTSYSQEKLAYSFHNAFSKYLILLHPADEQPTIVDNLNVIQVGAYPRTDISLVTWFSVREINMLDSSSCISDTEYSFSKCVSICYEKVLTSRINSTDSENVAHMPKKYDIRQFLQKRKLLLMSLDTYNKDSQVIKCRQTCKQNCKYSQYEFTTDNLVDYSIEEKALTKSNMFTLRVSAPYTEYVTEEEIYTKAKFLADFGGSLGLCFGVGLLTIYQYGFTILKKLRGWSLRLTNDKCSITNQGDNNPNYYEKHLKNIWIMCGICFFSMAFAVHSIELTVTYLKYQTVFVTNLVRDSPLFPSVTLCPDVPLDLVSLSLKGFTLNHSLKDEFCNSEFYCDRNQVIPYIMNNLPGIWESNLSLANVWDTKRHFNSFIKSFMFDNIESNGIYSQTLTTMGNCYTISPKKYIVNPLTLDIAFVDVPEYIAQEIYTTGFLFYEGKRVFYNITFLLHPQESSPLYLDGLKIIYDSRQLLRLALEVRAMVSRRISTPRQKCQRKPYSRKNCIDFCLLEEEAKAVGCRLPYLRTSALPLCNTNAQYEKSIKYNDFKHMAGNAMCQDKCKVQCNKIHYSLRPQAFVYDVARSLSDIHFRQRLSYSLEISEQIKTSFPSYLCELGGIMGLYLGISFLDLTTWFATAISKTMTRMRSVQAQTVSHFFRLIEIIWWLVLSTVLLIFCIHRLQEFSFNPKIYTKYSDEVHEWKHFPGITLCRWPPFNLTSLDSKGIDLEIKEVCGNGFFKHLPSCTGNFYSLMNKLPGIENDLIPDIWEQTAWNLSDILYSYNINGQDYVVNSSAVLHWIPIKTSLNQCFSFVPPNDTIEVSDLGMTLNVYHHKFKFKKKPSLFTIIMWLVLGIYSPHTLIRIHSPQDKPVLNDDVFDIPVYFHLSGQIFKITTTLTEASRLKAANPKCNEDEAYSSFNCIQQCLLEFIVQQENCILPFVDSSAVELCKATSYERFPKYLDQVSTKLHNYTELKKECVSRCPISCKSYSYDVTGEEGIVIDSIGRDHIKMMVTMGRDRHDKFEEILALSWPTFVAEVGGVAGTLTGMSLLMLFQVLVDTLGEMYKYFKGQRGK